LSGNVTFGSVFVAGSINMDVVATAMRFPKVGETIPGLDVHFLPGGKGANQAVAAARLGAPTTLIGRLGDDVFGHELKAFLTSQGVDLTHVVTTEKAQTGTALITVANTDNTVVVVPGANGLVEPSDVTGPVLKKGDVLVSQLEIPAATIETFFSRGRAARAKTILNPAPAVAFDHGLLDLVDIIVLNETELGTLTSSDLSDSDAPSKFVELLRRLRRSNDQILCVTLGRRGAIALVDDEVMSIEGHVVTPVDTTGAGDCFVGALAARIAGGANIREALGYANVAASICVQRMGAGPSMPTADEVQAVWATTPT
jgi:ribokinase